MYQQKIKNRFGSGVLKKCRGCQQHFGLFSDRWGLGWEFISQEFLSEFSLHELSCMTTGKWKPLNVDARVGTYTKMGIL